MDRFDMAIKVGTFAKRCSMSAPNNGAIERSDVYVGDMPVEEVLLFEDYFRGTTWPAAFDRATPGLRQCDVVGPKMRTGLCIVLEKKVVGDAAW